MTMRYGAKTRFICRITKAGIPKHTHNNSSLLLLTAIRIFCSSKTVPFHVNTGHFYVVASYFYVKNNKNGRYSAAIMVTRTRHNITLYVSRLSCVFRLSFPLSLTDFRDAQQKERKFRSSNLSFVICITKHNRITHSDVTL